jgi:hypothetical protein
MNVLYFLTIPDVRYPKCGKLYPISFIMCMAWIGAIAYVVTWYCFVDIPFQPKKSEIFFDIILDKFSPKSHVQIFISQL